MPLEEVGQIVSLGDSRITKKKMENSWTGRLRYCKHIRE